MFRAEEKGLEWISKVRALVDKHGSKKTDDTVLYIEAPSASRDP